MSKILSQTGISLADTYDVEGSIAGIENLESADVNLVHEMGSTIFSERLSGFVRRVTQTAIAQSTDFDMVMTGLPEGIYKILGITVLANIATRTTRIQASIRSTANGREVPFFVWESGNDTQSSIRIVEDGDAAADLIYFNVVQPFVPILGINRGQRQIVGDEIVCRGASNAFGAGTVQHTLLCYLALTHQGDISSFGLPVPSW